MYRNSYKYKIATIFTFHVLFFWGQEKHKLIGRVDVNVGITMFKNQYRNNLFNSYEPYLAKALNVGIEIYNKSSNFSLEARKAYWLGLTASSYSTDVSATASYNFVGITGYFRINNTKKIGLNVSHAWIAEYNSFFLLGNASASRKWGYQTDTYWTSKSISVAGAINISKNLFSELRFNYYYFISNYYLNNNFAIPKKGINDNRILLSFIYKLNKQ